MFFDFNKNTIRPQPAPFKINAALHTYTGRTLLFYNEEYYREIDERSFKIKKYGYTRDYFHGLPKDIDGAFRYIDGNIYFFKDNHIYMYNKFLDTIEKGDEKTILCIVGIKYTDRSKLIDLLSQHVAQ